MSVPDGYPSGNSGLTGGSRPCGLRSSPQTQCTIFLCSSSTAFTMKSTGQQLGRPPDPPGSDCPPGRRRRRRFDHVGVVVWIAARGNARHDGLGAAGVSGKIVVFNVAQTDAHESASATGRRISTGCRASCRPYVQLGEVQGIDAGYLPVDFARQVQFLLLGLPAVAVQGEHHGDGFGANAGPVPSAVYQWQHHRRAWGG